ncbi:DNA directed RNA polymeras-like protein III subunit Rpc82 [Byssothecium circinans]|uniref:DNA-directed RNA polymerase III subunit RPC3 n=1 Tax=Byssothecium circinans TaxID=147558 RepID=A0A6A5TGT8_9PLEO|nr:DNA directed RNA polymeras-like protein III subunit Rpc82 [Byssothecium circinans]
MSYTQRETPVLAELCTYLVEDHYGELAGRVYSILARYGRQTLHQMVRNSYLNRRQVSLGIVTLVQSHLIFHSSAVSPLAYYEIDWQQSYTLVRFGKIVKLVEARFGKNASTVIGNLLEHGHTRIGDLKNALFPPAEKDDHDEDEDEDEQVVNGTGLKRKRANGTHTNGTHAKVNGINGLTNGAFDGATVAGAEHGGGHDGSLRTVEEFYDAIEVLMQNGWVMKVDPIQYLGAGDYHQIAEDRARQQLWAGDAPPGIKAKNELHKHTLHFKRSIRDAWSEPPQFLPRKRKGNEQSNKRVKVNGANSWAAGGGDSGFGSALEELPIRLNRDKVAVAMRTEQLVRLVEQRLGPTTARIYEIMIRSVESDIPRCFEEWPQPVDPKATEEEKAANAPPLHLVTAHEVEKQTKDFDICEGLDPQAVSKITGRHLDKHGKLDYPVDPLTLGHHERLQLVHTHIELLSKDPFHFVTWHSRAGHSQWHIEFDGIAKGLIQHEIENTVQARNPQYGLKLVRALRRKGKLDERQACIAMMMPANDIRVVVNDLTVQGFIQTQEVPKVERREAKQSVHLIWYDRQRAREKLLHDTYKGMIRILQRIAFEKGKVQLALSKAERSDVIGNESIYLTRDELTQLNEWKATEEKLLLQLEREDDLVAVLRDFYGPLISP